MAKTGLAEKPSCPSTRRRLRCSQRKASLRAFGEALPGNQRFPAGAAIGPSRAVKVDPNRHVMTRLWPLPRLTAPATLLNGRSMPVPFRRSGSITSIKPKVVCQ